MNGTGSSPNRTRGLWVGLGATKGWGALPAWRARAPTSVARRARLKPVFPVPSRTKGEGPSSEGPSVVLWWLRTPAPCPPA